jgi:hypothetical protein
LVEGAKNIPGNPKIGDEGEEVLGDY